MKLQDRLREYVEQSKKATPGPWKNDCGNGQIETLDWRVLIAERVGNYGRRKDVEGMYPDYAEDKIPEVEALLAYDNENDMDFIAASRTLGPLAAEKLLEALDVIEWYANGDNYLFCTCGAFLADCNSPCKKCADDNDAAHIDRGEKAAAFLASLDQEAGG